MREGWTEDRKLRMQQVDPGLVKDDGRICGPRLPERMLFEERSAQSGQPDRQCDEREDDENGARDDGAGQRDAAPASYSEYAGESVAGAALAGPNGFLVDDQTGSDKTRARRFT